MMVNSADIMGTHAVVCQSTHSFLAPRPGERGMLPVVPALGGNSQHLRATLENKSQGLLG